MRLSASSRQLQGEAAQASLNRLPLLRGKQRRHKIVLVLGSRLPRRATLQIVDEIGTLDRRRSSDRSFGEERGAFANGQIGDALVGRVANAILVDSSL